MRAALWFLALFAIAVAVALFAGNNQGSVTFFWPPHRVDVSLNLALLLAVGAFLLVHGALRALAALFDLPRQAWRWRLQQKERAMHAAVLDALAHLWAGRFVRARRAAESALAQERAWTGSGTREAAITRLKSLAHLLAAESAHALQDRVAREDHLRQAQESSASRDVALREAAALRAASWALDGQEPDAALDWLRGLPSGAARRTLSLRLRLKASQLAGRTAEALETARLLAKHHGFTTGVAGSLVRGLALDLLHSAHDASQLRRAWMQLEAAERERPELAIAAANRLLRLAGEPAEARAWLLPAWQQQATLAPDVKARLVRVLEDALDPSDVQWLARMESAQRADPRDAYLQYLVGVACMKRQLWGKAQQLLAPAAATLADPALRRAAWRALARLAEQRQDAAEAAQAWKHAAS